MRRANAAGSFIYLDFNATTPVATDVVTAMAPFWTDAFYNPASTYPEASAVQDAITIARKALATLLGTEPHTIVFTSGGTESNNWVFHSVWKLRPSSRYRVVLSAMEHPAVSQTAAALESLGAEITMIPVNSQGVIRMDVLEDVLDERTALVSVMLVNNEIGTVQPIAEITQRAHAVGALMHTDAAQAVGKIPIDVKALGVDFLTVAGHKFYAPKGIGALYIRSGVQVSPILNGGGQQDGRRSGTEPVPLIVGLGKAAQLAYLWLQKDGPARQVALRNTLEQQLREANPAITVFGEKTERIPNTIAMAHPDWPGPTLLALCPAIRAGTGSACHHPNDMGSPTLQAMGVAPELARGLVRLSFGRETMAADLDVAVAALSRALQQRSVT